MCCSSRALFDPQLLHVRFPKCVLVPFLAEFAVYGGYFADFRVRDPELFVGASFRTIALSGSEGVRAVIGKLKTAP